MMPFEKLKLLFFVCAKKGIANVLRVIFFRLQSKLGYFELILPIKKEVFQQQEIFLAVTPDALVQPQVVKTPYIACANHLIEGRVTFFFEHEFMFDTPPDWFWNPFVGSSWCTDKSTHWSKLKHFPAVGDDIKVIWELSRFYWLPQFACAIVLTENQLYLDKANQWVFDWVSKNPVNEGYQWVCAQEVGIRLINFILASVILQNVEITHSAKRFIELHCERIIPTMHYAQAQQNNHATSEAAALFIAGIYLKAHCDVGSKISKKADKWLRLGKKYLEKCSAYFVMQDGTFSQYSVTYHRLVLDTFSLCVYFQKKYKLALLSKKFFDKYQLLFEWLFQLVDPASGNAPNLGSNDGTILFRLGGMSYRNFKPCIQLASALIFNKLAYENGCENDVLNWLGLSCAELSNMVSHSIHFTEGGLVKFVNDNSWAIIRYPKFKFKPCQEDVFHFDLWVAGVNVLIDSGSYAYNERSDVMDQFKSVQAHNVVQIDNLPQMRKVSRFMYADWPSLITSNYLPKEGFWQGSYRDFEDHFIQRSVVIKNNQYCVTDTIRNVKHNATLRWHLSPEYDWIIEHNRCMSSVVTIEIFVNGVAVDQLELMDGEYSTIYLQKKLNKVLIVPVRANQSAVLCFLTTITITN